MKQWEKPKLIALVRSDPEEAVLTACKYPPTMSGNPNTQYLRCIVFNQFGCNVSCSAVSAS